MKICIMIKMHSKMKTKHQQEIILGKKKKSNKVKNWKIQKIKIMSMRKIIRERMS